MVIWPEFWATAGTGALVAIGRSVVGWWENSFKDGKLQRHEWNRLFSTITNIVMLSVFSYFGLELGVGVDMPAIGHAGIGALASVGLSAWKKSGTKK